MVFFRQRLFAVEFHHECPAVRGKHDPARKTGNCTKRRHDCHAANNYRNS